MQARCIICWHINGFCTIKTDQLELYLSKLRNSERIIFIILDWCERGALMVALCLYFFDNLATLFFEVSLFNQYNV